ncbi:MAG: 4Fe-4S binding protein [Candidatus Bipolaricaulota bacterium]|nr:MAG: 4Fe-4S binding protein [Candidatus Bipolaricaulota bacterium]
MDEVAEAVEGYTATTIPVHVEIDAKQAVLNLKEAERLLDEAKRIALGPCACRTEKGNCDAPIDTCLALDENCDEALETWDGFRLATREEALATLRAAHEEGLVHLAFRKPGKGVSSFCSCCSCCCWFLGALSRFDYHDAIVESSHVARQDRDLCIGCGTCADRCQFGAWRHSGDDWPELEQGKCFGCGLCVSTCPAAAISLVSRRATGVS